MPKQERGEHSRHNEDEKPLKKARYVWQVKGKYHLKETQNKNTISPYSNEAQTSDESAISDHDYKFGSDDETRGTSKCCVESFLSKAEALMDSDMDDEVLLKNNDIEGTITASLVSTEHKNHEYYIQKWQAKQIARGFVDNTLNSVLESWINPPFDAADFVENCANDGQVEDDAILMAIQSHGLQSSIPERDPSLEESTRDNFQNFQTEMIKEQEIIVVKGDDMSCESSSSNDSEQEVEDPMDFLNTAVSVAIGKKGLSYTY